MGAGVGSRIGVSIRDVERAEQDDGLTEGVVVADVLEEGPARTAGMETGDVVVEFDGERIRSARQLSRMVADTPAGRAVTVEERRGSDDTLAVWAETSPPPSRTASTSRTSTSGLAARAWVWR